MWRLSGRLRDPVVVTLIEHGDSLRQEYWQLGIEYFLRGLSMEDLADLHPHREQGTSAYVWHLFDRLDDLRPLLRP